MQWPSQKFQNSHTRKSGDRLGFVFSLLTAFAVIASQVFPASAGQSNGTHSLFVEICSSNGSYYVQVDENDQKPEQQCSHCGFCLIPVSEFTAFQHFASDASDIQTDLGLRPYAVVTSPNLQTPEQYWSANRGPPLPNKKNPMTISNSLPVAKPDGNAPDVWRSSCV